MPMLLLVEICLVMACLAVVSVAVATVRTMVRVQNAADQVARLTQALQHSLVEVDDLTREARETLASVRESIAPIRRVAERLEAVGNRTANLSTSVLEEVEPALRTAMAVARGVRSSTHWWLERLVQRFTNGHAASPRKDQA